MPAWMHPFTAALVVLLCATPLPAAASADACAAGIDAGSNPVEAARLMKGVSCAGAVDPSDPQDWYFVDVPLSDQQATLHFEFCRPSSLLEIEVSFLPAGAALPWTGTSEAGAPQGDDINLGPVLGGSISCLTDALHPDMQPARPFWPASGGGRFYVRIADQFHDQSLPFTGQETYTLRLW